MVVTGSLCDALSVMVTPLRPFPERSDLPGDRSAACRAGDEVLCLIATQVVEGLASRAEVATQRWCDRVAAPRRDGETVVSGAVGGGGAALRPAQCQGEAKETVSGDGNLPGDRKRAGHGAGDEVLYLVGAQVVEGLAGRTEAVATQRWCNRVAAACQYGETVVSGGVGEDGPPALRSALPAQRHGDAAQTVSGKGDLAGDRKRAGHGSSDKVLRLIATQIVEGLAGRTEVYPPSEGVTV